MKKYIFLVIIVFIIICSFIVKLNLNEEESNSYELDSNAITEKNEIEENTSKELVEVSIYKINDWKDSEKCFSNFEIKIKNNSDSDISNWNINLNSNSNFEIVEFWNGKFSIEENKLIISNVDYNSTIKVNEEISVGCIVSSEIEIELSVDKDFKEEIKKDLEKNDEINFDNDDKNEFTPLEKHGKLIVEENKILDKNGKVFQMQGISTHSISDFNQYINYECFKTLRDDWNVNTIRLALYSDTNLGYRKELHSKVEEGVEYATKLGMYVIIDWHILSDYDPNMNKESAKVFFSEMANKFKDYDNIFYEICNEPNGNINFDRVKIYAEEIIPLIRNIDDDSIIIVGTPNYCQKLDEVWDNRIDEKNLLYALHFYSGTHKGDLRNVLKMAVDRKLPVIVSEFGLSDASGNGGIDKDEGEIWINYLRENSIGYVCWNLSNKNESSALLKPETTSTTEFSDEQLSEQGLWIKNKYNN